MTFLSKLINPDRKERQVICENPTHPIITFYSKEIRPKCPICTNDMVTVIKSALTEIDNPLREK